VAYATKMAAALSGATVNQLRHWRSPRTGPLLVPEIATGPGVVYSFQDVLALRTFVRLRENASLQKIRAAIGNLRDIGEVDHLASYRLVSDKGGNSSLSQRTRL
jgi:DNA-binding transcriptional MerR regulator